MKWQKVRLEEVIANFDRIRVPLSTVERENRHGPYPYYGANGIIDYVDGYLFEGDYLLLAEDGNTVVNEDGYPTVHRAHGQFWVNNHAHIFKSVSGYDQNYLYYLLKRTNFRPAVTGAAQPKINQANMNNIGLEFPPLPIQQKIASILGAYDDLIENNRRRIELLEKMARELYRERFVRRAGSRSKVSISEICAIQYGYVFNAKMFNTTGNGLPIIRIRNIPLGMSSDYTTEPAADAYVVHDGEVLVGMDGEFHINLWSGGDAYLVQRSCCFRPFDEVMKGYLMEAIRAPIKYFESSAMGATVGHLGKKDIDTIDVYIPNAKEKELFRSMFDERLSLSLQNRSLVKQRDRLLPRLMSGKIDLDKFVKEAE